MGISPDSAVSPTQQAPPDRATLTLEKWAQDGLALLFGDHKLDQNERLILRDFMQEVAIRAQNGGIGNGGTPQPPGAEPQPAPMTPQAMNQDTEELGSQPGTEPRGDDYLP